MRTTVSFRLSSLPSRAGSLRRTVVPALLAAATLLGTSACSSWNLETPPSARRVVAFLMPYKPDIVQGNVVTKEQLALVRPGMSRVQVRDALGSPLLTDLFHTDRWDYVFTIKRPGTQPQRRSVVLLFEGDKLTKIDAPELPSEREFVAAISRTSARGNAAPLELTQEELAALPVPPKPPAPPPEEPSGPVRTYPPLEPD